MVFNSVDFAIFLVVVFIGYWFVTYKNLKLQNLFIVSASYYFYGLWNWQFLFVRLFSTFVDYKVGLLISNEKKKYKRKLFLWISIVINLGLLFFFKYNNFFLENFFTVFSFLGTFEKHNSLNIILPLGISFFTFQSIGYCIDVYKGKTIPTKDFIAFSAFVTYFPQLVAGPIERANALLPQFLRKRNFEYDKAIDGLRQILWGLFKKIVIADNCANYANFSFNYNTIYSSELVIGAILFGVQLYADFSGYSDIAIGVSRLFGINLNRNFAFPFLSRNMAEFWSRWHISLTTWFRDYLFLPMVKLNKSRGRFRISVILFIQFILIGLWHGANWTYVVWGIINAIFLLPLVLNPKKVRYTTIVAYGKVFPTWSEFFKIIKTYILIVFSIIFFRSKTIYEALIYVKYIFTLSIFTFPAHFMSKNFITTMLLVVFFFAVEWNGREKQYAIENLGDNWKSAYRYGFYYLLIFFIFLFKAPYQQFIYFQF